VRTRWPSIPLSPTLSRKGRGQMKTAVRADLGIMRRYVVLAARCKNHTDAQSRWLSLPVSPTLSRKGRGQRRTQPKRAFGIKRLCRPPPAGFNNHGHGPPQSPIAPWF
jgi:hypothetical protein